MIQMTITQQIPNARPVELASIRQLQVQAHAFPALTTQSTVLMSNLLAVRVNVALDSSTQVMTVLMMTTVNRAGLIHTKTLLTTPRPAQTARQILKQMVSC